MKKYQKFSRRHGTITLNCYASGNGALSFTWLNSDNKAIGESVTESDASEFLEISHNSLRYTDWIIMNNRNHGEHTLLVRPMIRLQGRNRIAYANDPDCAYNYSVWPKHIDGEEYRWHEVLFYSKNEYENREIHNLGMRLSMLFFLNNEEQIKRAMKEDV